jgi:hypothetical protein
VDPIYRGTAMARAKARHFAQGPWLHSGEAAPGAAGGRRAVVIAGSGPSGRTMARLLQAEGVAVRCFLDDADGPPSRRVMGLPAHGFPGEIPPRYFEAHRGAFFLGCVAQEDGRGRLLRHFRRAGLASGRDFLLFA